MIQIKLIVAMDEQRGIGKNNDLMWHLPADMKFFKETTTDHIVVMGRKNYESIPEKFRPLPNRENVVLTRNLEYMAPNCQIFHRLEDCIGHFEARAGQQVLFIIGGGEIYKQALKLNVIDEMLITHVHAKFDADTFFPEIDSSNWNIESVLSHESDEKNKCDFEIKRYIKKGSL